MGDGSGSIGGGHHRLILLGTVVGGTEVRNDWIMNGDDIVASTGSVDALSTGLNPKP